MPLVNYSDSESGQDEGEPASKPTPLNSSSKRKRGDEDTKANDPPARALPPLPAAFHDLYATNVRVSVRDDPSLHDGRKRVTPHMEGNWPTHIYLEWYPNQTELNFLSKIISNVNVSVIPGEKSVHSLLHSDLGAQMPLHISLSRPIVLLTDQRQPFNETFATNIKTFGIKPFDVRVTAVDWVANFEGNRWFLVMRLSKPADDGLNALLRASNVSVTSFGQPPLYSSPIHQQSSRGRGAGRGRGRGASERFSRVPRDIQYMDSSGHFHISIAWRLEEPAEQVKAKTAAIDLESLGRVTITFNSVKTKIGNAVNTVPLSSRAPEERGFSGL